MSSTPPRVGLYTLGCKVSQYETEAVAEAFAAAGFEVCSFDGICDVYVVNTCTVTAESDRKSRQMIRRAIKKNPDAAVIVMGCYSQRAADEVMRIDGVDAVIGTDNKLSAVRVARELLDKKRESYLSVTDVNTADFEPMCITRAERTRAYVKIEDGCECRCSYCAIADARGRVRSKAPADVIAEVEGLSRSGVCEIVLTGIETGSYGRDFDYEYGLADLIRELDSRASARRLRLGSLAPELVGREFIEKVRDCGILAPHFHLSVQSGSDAVLRRMKRRYNSRQALDNIRMIRENIPGAAFTTDLMVGFPGETEEDFQRTVDFAREARFIDAHVFAYSRRKGTPAADYPDQIDEATKHARSEELIRVCRGLRDSVLSEIALRGEPLSVILETYDGEGYSAHSDSFAEVYVPLSDPNMGGEMVKVLPVSSFDGKITAKMI